MDKIEALKADIKLLEDGIVYLDEVDPCSAHNSAAYKRAMQRVVSRLKDELREEERKPILEE